MSPVSQPTLNTPVEGGRILVDMTAPSEIWLTQEAYDRLAAELDERSGPLRAEITKRIEIARKIIRLPERHEVFQEARLDFGAEKWGLAAGAAPQIILNDDDVEDDSDDGVI